MSKCFVPRLANERMGRIVNQNWRRGPKCWNHQKLEQRVDRSRKPTLDSNARPLVVCMHTLVASQGIKRNTPRNTHVTRKNCCSLYSRSLPCMLTRGSVSCLPGSRCPRTPKFIQYRRYCNRRERSGKGRRTQHNHITGQKP